jgi:ATP/maltotriose-dependent transcriptional regulator MalT
MPIFLARKAEALHFAGRTSEALQAISEAETVAERFEQRYFCAELHRLRGVLLAAMGAEGTQIEASFCTGNQNRTGAEVDFARETRRRKLRGIPQAKSA